MTSLPETTIHRLQRLPQIAHVWEGDRISVRGIIDNIDPDITEDSDCIIWLDGSDGFVRSMDIVRAGIGKEAMVRSLLKAMENPQNPAKPALPQKIVVKDRELQFLLRGVLQNLDIKVDYKPDLPLIDELWQNFYTLQPQKKSNVSHQLLSALEKVALSCIWESQPWEIISEEEIIKVKINRWDVENLYICVMGMLGQEFGVILYRSIESLQNFRQTILDLGDSPEEGELEAAFLQQDCWFLNFSEDEDEDEPSFTYKQNFHRQVRPIFGSIHPYEGIRSLKEEEEVLPIYMALKALTKFLKECDEELLEDSTETIEKEYKLKIPLQNSYVKVNLTTMPEFTRDLEKIWDDKFDNQTEDEDEELHDFINNELIPEGTLISFKSIDRQQLLSLAKKSHQYISPLMTNQIQKQVEKQEFPVIILQTTRPKAQSLINKLQAEKGISNVVFAVGNNPTENMEYDLGIFQTEADNFYLFGQFPYTNYLDSPRKAISHWKNDVAQFDGYCGIIIAMGASGISRGNPRDKDLLCLFYTQVLEDNQFYLNN